MHALIVNRQTGEVVGTDTPAGIRQMRGVIRNWMALGLNIHDFDVLEWSSFNVYKHLRDYAWQFSLMECDVCSEPTQHRNIVWFDDSEGVTLLCTCKSCSGREGK